MKAIFFFGLVALVLAGCGIGRSIGHRHVQQGSVRLVLKDIYLQDGLLWFRLAAYNRSAFDLRVDWVSFTMRQRHPVRRTAQQEIRLQPVFLQQPILIPGDSSAVFLYGLLPRVPGRDKELVIELRERNGDRRVRIVIGGKQLLKIKKHFYGGGIGEE